MTRNTWLLLACLLTITPHAAGLDIKVSDTRGKNFYLEALEWVLNKSQTPFQLNYLNLPPSSQKRKVFLLKNGVIDVMYAGTSTELEQQLLPVRIPIMRGLIGQRLFLINARHQYLYDRVRSLVDLKQRMGLQGIGWSDTQVLRAAGLPQLEKLYDDIFVSLNDGSHNYFPRGMTEIFDEWQAHRAQHPHIVIEERLALSYKAAVLFFVHPENTQLARALEKGFTLGYEDGSYEQFFYTHPLIVEAFDAAALDERTILRVANPYLSEATRNIPARYWHQN